MNNQGRQSYKSKEQPVRNHPGIYKRFIWDAKAQRYVDSGKYRATRRDVVNGRSKKTSANFDSFEDAKAFRAGLLEKSSTGSCWHRTQPQTPAEGMLLSELIENEWKPYHYLKVEGSTQAQYNKLLPAFDFLADTHVNQITVRTIDGLIHYWVTDYPKSHWRKGFSHELDLLRTVLNFYRQRINPTFALPVFEDHYKAATISKEGKKVVTSLSAQELGLFLDELRDGNNPMHYSVALTQFSLGLRFGECAAIRWEAIDLDRRTALIDSTVVWDQRTWEPTIKQRTKNGSARMGFIPEVLATELYRVYELRDKKVPLVFHKEGQPLNRKTIATAFNRSLKRLGLSHVSGTHFLRKAAATLVTEATGDFFAVQKLMDHSSPNVTIKYVAHTSSQKLKVAAALDAALTTARPLLPAPTKT
ncbi:tyrosine-type recombinase/integrase [Bdellovibrionota bacterium FG-2]